MFFKLKLNLRWRHTRFKIICTASIVNILLCMVIIDMFIFKRKEFVTQPDQFFWSRSPVWRQSLGNPYASVWASKKAIKKWLAMIHHWDLSKKDPEKMVLYGSVLSNRNHRNLFKSLGILFGRCLVFFHSGLVMVWIRLPNLLMRRQRQSNSGSWPAVWRFAEHHGDAKVSRYFMIFQTLKMYINHLYSILELWKWLN